MGRGVEMEVAASLDSLEQDPATFGIVGRARIAKTTPWEAANRRHLQVWLPSVVVPTDGQPPGQIDASRGNEDRGPRSSWPRRCESVT